MATPDDVDQEYRSLARKVPAVIRARMTGAELRLRCEIASDLLEDNDPRATRQAKRILEACSLSSFMAISGKLSAEALRAKERNDPGAMRDIARLIEDLWKKHPQPVFDLDSGEDARAMEILAEVTSNSNSEVRLAEGKPRRGNRPWRKK